VPADAPLVLRVRHGVPANVALPKLGMEANEATTATGDGARYISGVEW
jgi:hypothetical protein